jgi:large subunit ribosomal protein L30
MDKKKTKKETPKKGIKAVIERVTAKAPKKEVVKKKGKPAAKAFKPAKKKPAPTPIAKTPVERKPSVEAGARPAAEAAPRPKPLAKEKTYSGQTVRLRWFRSIIGTPEKHKLVVKGLGFHRLNEIIIRPDNPMIRGMVKCVPHLVEIVD